jgi:LysM repeat protein
MTWRKWIFGGLNVRPQKEMAGDLLDEVRPRRLGQVRWLSQLLILSGAFNIASLFLFAHTYLKSREEKSHFAWKPIEIIENSPLPTNRAVLSRFQQLSLEELIEKLASTSFVEDGFAERDLALACLTALHHVDLERALGFYPSDIRSLKWSEEGVATLYPALKETDWGAICLFCRKERWPLTPQGLFLQARQQGDQIAASLADALFLTPQFHLAEVLLSRAEPPVTRLETLALLLEGDWQLIDEYTKEQRRALDLSDGRRRRLLVDYLCRGSALAVRLLVRSDAAYAVHYLTDELVIQALNLLSTPSPEGERLALELLSAPRSSQVWAAAAANLYRYKGKEPADPVLEEKKELIHEVQNGDSLWGLAKKYHTSVDAIIQSNRLQQETIRPGQKLKIPQGTGS